MLDQLQRQLTDINGVDPGHDVSDYLITDRHLAAALGQGALMPTTDETVLLSQDEEGLALSIYLDEAMLSRLRSSDPFTQLRAEQLSDLWTVLEGISHFNYLTWCAERDRPVTLLELEMQAEVDKFVASLSLVLAQGELEMSANLHGWLFGSVSFRAELDAQQLRRYRAANEYASRFCHRMRARLIEGNDSAFSELRQFYRLSQQGKISHIHSCAWSDH